MHADHAVPPAAGWPGGTAADRARRKVSTASGRRRAGYPDDGAGLSAGPRPAQAWFSFRRIVDVPFGTCVAALESGQLTGPDGGRRVGQALVGGPAEHDRDCGTCRVQVRLARGPLRPPLRMRLQADHWSSSPPQTALELIPCGHVRPSAAYFRAGHLLLDSLARSLARPVPAQRPDRAAASQPHADQGQPGPDRSAAPASPVPGMALPGRRPGQTDGLSPAAPTPRRTAEYQSTAGQEHDMARFMDFHEDLKLPAEAVAQIAEDARNATADPFGVRQIELYHNPDGKVYCLLEGPDEDAIRKHHAALGVPCGDVHQVDSLS
jgi:Protein of unknown function (DUF4242)